MKGVECMTVTSVKKKQKRRKEKDRILAPGRDFNQRRSGFSLLGIRLSVAQNATCKNSLQGLAMFDVDNAGRKQIEHLS